MIADAIAGKLFMDDIISVKLRCSWMNGNYARKF
jgi:hypothetical protein